MSQALIGLTFIGLTLTFSTVSAQAQAQDAGTPSATLTDAVRATITHNPQVQAAWHAFQAAEQDMDQAWGEYLPSLDATGGVGIEDQQRDSRGSYDTRFAELTLTQMVWNGFATRNDIKRLDRARLVRYYELLGASENVALEAARSYLDVRRYRELVRLAQSNYERHQEVYGQVEARVMSGAGRGVNLEQISGRLALAESNLMTEVSNLHDVLARYQRIVGELPPRRLTPAPALDENTPGVVLEAVNQAFENNPEFHAAIENIQSLQAEHSTNYAEFQPRLELQARTGMYDSANGTFDPQGFQERHEVELVASMNLYRGGIDLASLRAADQRVERAMSEREVICHNIRQTTQIAYNDTRHIRQQLIFIDQHRQSSGRVRRAYQQQFNLGQRTLLDVLDSENEYFEASRSYTNARYEAQIADARLLASMGQLMTTLGVMRDDIPTLDEMDAEGVQLDAQAICPIERDINATLAELVPDRLLGAPSNSELNFTLSADTLFSSGSAELNTSARRALSEIVQAILLRSDVVKVRIAGHADSRGSDALNEPLSQQRAESVARYLERQGIDAALLETRGYGSRQPVAGNDSEEGRSRNRRVEVTLETDQDVIDTIDTDEEMLDQDVMNQEPVEQGVLERPVDEAAVSTEAATDAREVSVREASATEAGRYLQLAALQSKESAVALKQTLSQQLEAQQLEAPVRLHNGEGFYRVQVSAGADMDARRRELAAMGYEEILVVRH